MSYRKRGLLLGFVLVAFAVLGTAVAAAGDDPQPVDFTHNVVDAPAPVAGAVFGTGPAVKTGTAICTTATQTDGERQHRLRDATSARTTRRRSPSTRPNPTT